VRIDADERRIGLSIKAAQETDEEFVGSEDYRRAVSELRPGDQLVDVGNVFDEALEGFRIRDDDDDDDDDDSDDDAFDAFDDREDDDDDEKLN
jgi:ribosomal protein S1